MHRLAKPFNKHMRTYMRKISRSNNMSTCVLVRLHYCWHCHIGISVSVIVGNIVSADSMNVWVSLHYINVIQMYAHV